jgi:hypothetical protein
LTPPAGGIYTEKADIFKNIILISCLYKIFHLPLQTRNYVQKASITQLVYDELELEAYCLYAIRERIENLYDLNLFLVLSCHS